MRGRRLIGPAGTWLLRHCQLGGERIRNTKMAWHELRVSLPRRRSILEERGSTNGTANCVCALTVLVGPISRPRLPLIERRCLIVAANRCRRHCPVPATRRVRVGQVIWFRDYTGCFFLSLKYSSKKSHLCYTNTVCARELYDQGDMVYKGLIITFSQRINCTILITF